MSCGQPNDPTSCCDPPPRSSSQPASAPTTEGPLDMIKIMSQQQQKKECCVFTEVPGTNGNFLCETTPPASTNVASSSNPLVFQDIQLIQAGTSVWSPFGPQDQGPQPTQPCCIPIGVGAVPTLGGRRRTNLDLFGQNDWLGGSNQFIPFSSFK